MHTFRRINCLNHRLEARVMTTDGLITNSRVPLLRRSLNGGWKNTRYLEKNKTFIFRPTGCKNCIFMKKTNESLTVDRWSRFNAATANDAWNFNSGLSSSITTKQLSRSCARWEYRYRAVSRTMGPRRSFLCTTHTHDEHPSLRLT